MAARTTRAATVLVVVVAVVLAALFGLRTLWHAASSQLASPECTVGDWSIDTGQASVAAQMVGEVARFHPALPAKASVLVLMAGLQESKLENLAPGAGDRDSVGVLQQRPSQGWGGGDATLLTDVTEATREFLAALVKVPHWRSMDDAAAIQAVQISADGSAYAQHQDEATALAAALSGRRPAAISCSFDAPTVVADPARVAALVRAQLPVHAPTPAARSVRVPGAAWQTAAWFVANADRLGIAEVDYAGRRWTRTDGWTRARAGRDAVVATLATVG